MQTILARKLGGVQDLSDLPIDVALMVRSSAASLQCVSRKCREMRAYAREIALESVRDLSGRALDWSILRANRPREAAHQVCAIHGQAD